MTILVLWQGGIPDPVWILFALVCATCFAIKIRVVPPPWFTIPFMICIALYCLSTIVHGCKVEYIVTTIKLLSIFIWIWLCYQTHTDCREAIMISGAVAATVGIIAFSVHAMGLISETVFVKDWRLSGTFQYANAYALYLVICAFLMHTGSDKWGKRIAFILDIAIVLTQSVGALSVYILGWYLYAFLRKRKVFWMISAALPAVAVVGFLSFGLRPVSTYLDRLMQITDAMKTAAANPIGIGPGAWKYEVFERQTAFYTANVMHSGFAAIATDAGFLALAAVFVLIFLFAANQKKEMNHRKDAKYAFQTKNAQRANDAQLPQTRIAVVMILFHALFDFSLSFLSVTTLLGILVAQLLPQERIFLRKIRTIRVSGAAVVLLILLIPLFSRIGITKTEYYRQIAEENFQMVNMTWPPKMLYCHTITPHITRMLTPGPKA